MVALGNVALPGAEDDPQPPPNRPNREELKERGRNLAPAERQKMIREFRERHGFGGTNRSEWEKRREELKNLPPREREAKLKEWRQRTLQGRQGFHVLSHEERETKRKELKQRIDSQLAELQKKKTEGTLSPFEQRRLERLQQMSQRLAERAETLPPPAAAPGPR